MKCNFWRFIRRQRAPNEMSNSEAMIAILFLPVVSSAAIRFLSLSLRPPPSPLPLLFYVQRVNCKPDWSACFTMSSAWLILQSICSGSFSLWNLCLLRTNTNTCGTNRKQTKGFKSAYQPMSESSHLTDGAINKTVKCYDCVKVPLSANNPLLSYYCSVRMDSNWE